jgi:uncharacterized protein YjiS (DUF1127 family)
METSMSNNIPVLPIAGSTVVRTFLAVLSLVTRWLKEFARTRRHRREVAALAGLDRRMLADIGISRADLEEVFTQPFREDPTGLLRESACERRASRDTARCVTAPSVQTAFRRPSIDRLPRYLI